jgi:hypothetical protein
MSEVRSNLVIRLDEGSQRFVFFLSKKQGEHSPETAAFSVDIEFEELKARGPEGAERLVGECVLGFFDRLTDGRLDLPKHYTCPGLERQDSG